jgi:dihydroorotase/N-acyl-D-amino-acid deacylase
MHKTYIAALLVIALLSTGAFGEARAQEIDLLIKDARIIDGSGGPAYLADVAVRGDVIVRIARRIDAPARKVVDARGKVVAPGFIDIHVHARDGVFKEPTAENYVRQGVTTLVEGPDGGSPLPVGPFLDRVAATAITPNFALFVGQGSVRDAVMGTVDRRATPAQIDEMRKIVRQAMADGAFGLSTGLFYVPGAFTPTDEIVELAKVAGEMGGLHISHMRNEATQIVDSVRETIEIGEKGRLPTQITHHKIIGALNWGKSVDTLRMVDEARARGVDVSIDQYPYTASSTSIHAALLPTWALEGGRDRLLERLRDASARSRIRAETIRLIKEERGGGDPGNVQLASCEWDPSFDGKRLSEVTEGRKLAATVENAADTVLWLTEQGECLAIFHAIDESDLQRILKHPATMVASDGGIQVYGQAHPHPRSYGTFVRVLGRYVRELRVITLEDAIWKMSGHPAKRLGLKDRGVVQEGLKADLVVFDPDTVRDAATFTQPHQYAEGVALVAINGQIAFENGRMTAARPGRVLYGRGTSPSRIAARTSCAAVSTPSFCLMTD